jgi:hypothetical protein
MTTFRETERRIGQRPALAMAAAAIVLSLGGLLLQAAAAAAAGPSGGEHYPEAGITDGTSSTFWWCRKWWCA